LTLAHPAALWLLALAIPIVLFHLRMRRKVRVVVPSLLAFDAAALGGAPPRAAGLRPRDLLALLLECGALACLSLAAAGPARGGAPAAPRALAIVLDGSASTMAAGRFEEERALARRALDAAGPDAPVTLLLAAGTPRVLAAATEPRGRVDAALAAARPLAVGAGALAAAADLAVASGAEVLVLTDGCDADAPALARRKDLRLVSVGRPERNRGIVGGAIDLRRDGRHGLFLRVREEDGTVKEVDRSDQVRSGGGGAPGLVKSVETLSIRLDGPPDALAVDDFIEFRGEVPSPLRVAVVAPGGRPEAWLAAALEACGPVLDPGASATVDPSALANLAASPDVLVLAGAAVATDRPCLVLGAGAGDAMEAPSVQAGERLHPVMRGVDPAEWIVTKSRTVEAAAGDAVLLQGPKGPLAVAGKRDGARRVVLAFDPGQSTLPLSGSWPVFLRNALLWLSGEGGAPAAAAARDPEKGPLLDATESDLVPRVPRDADAFAPAARAAAVSGPRPLAPLLAALAAAFLLAEWTLFAAPGAARRRRREFLGATPAPP
jgi:hypothetical protein